MSEELTVLEKLRNLKVPEGEEFLIMADKLLETNPELIEYPDLPEKCFRIDSETGFITRDEEKNNIKTDLFRIDHSKDAVSKGKILLPVLDYDDLHFFTFEDPKSKNLYHSYNSTVNFKIEYQQLNLLKIVAFKGKKVLNPSEEKHLKVIEEEKKIIMLAYEDKEWKLIQDEAKFNDKRKENEELIKSEGIIKINSAYKKQRKEYNKLLADYRAGGKYDEFIEYTNKLLTTTREFHEIQNIIGKINEEHYELINKEIRKIEEEVEKLERIFNSEKVEEFQKSDSAIKVLTKITHLLEDEGYWVVYDELYASIGRYYILNQKSNVNRNRQTLSKLKDALIGYAQQEGIEDCILLNDANFQTYFKKSK